MAYIFFDIDGTLMSADANFFPQVRPAWDRLKAGIEMTSLQLSQSNDPLLQKIGQQLRLPVDFDWKAHTGETDLGVILNIISSLGLKHSDCTYYKIPSKIMLNMHDYYIQMMRNVDIVSEVNKYKFSGVMKYNSLVNMSNIPLPPIDEIPLFYTVYEDVWTVLNYLKRQGHKLGIVTGNAKDVTREKLRLSGLNMFFSDESLWFTGDMAETRSELLLKAWMSTFGNEGEIMSLNYVGDAIKDIQAVQRLREGIYYRGKMISLSPLISQNIFIRWPEHSLVRAFVDREGREIYQPGGGYPEDKELTPTHLFYFYKLNPIVERIA